MLRTPKEISHKPVPSEVELVGKKVLDAAFKVHSGLGPGLMESVTRLALHMKYVKAD